MNAIEQARRAGTIQGIRERSAFVIRRVRFMRLKVKSFELNNSI